METNIEPIYAPAHDHRAKGLVERLIQTIKRQLSCMKAQLNKNIKLQHAIHAINQKVRITQQKTFILTSFEAHCGTLQLLILHVNRVVKI